jgi:hypothetical protein
LLRRIAKIINKPQMAGWIFKRLDENNGREMKINFDS